MINKQVSFIAILFILLTINSFIYSNENQNKNQLYAGIISVNDKIQIKKDKDTKEYKNIDSNTKPAERLLFSGNVIKTKAKNNCNIRIWKNMKTATNDNWLIDIVVYENSKIEFEELTSNLLKYDLKKGSIKIQYNFIIYDKKFKIKNDYTEIEINKCNGLIGQISTNNDKKSFRIELQKKLDDTSKTEIKYKDIKTKEKKQHKLDLYQSMVIEKGKNPRDADAGNLYINASINNLFFYGNVINKEKEMFNYTQIKPSLIYTFRKNAFLAIRLKLFYLKDFDDDKNDDLSGEYLGLDRFYYKVEFENFGFKIGRANYYIGKGLILDNIGNGLELEFINPYVNFRVFSCYSGLMELKEEYKREPFKTIPDNYNDKHRIFAGTEISFLNDVKDLDHEFYLEFLYQSRIIDKNDTIDYRSGYIGLGFEGDFNYIKDSGKKSSIMSYSMEGVYQFGQTPSNSPNISKNISAYAYLGEMAFWLHDNTNMRLFGGYTMASGDKDRVSANISETIFSSKDKMFYSFADFNTGFAFKPGLSNIQIITGGYQITPTFGENIHSIDVILRYQHYIKHVKDSPIQIYELQTRGSNLGYTVDLFLKYKYDKLFSIFVDSGIFKPNEGLADTSTRFLVVSGISVNLSILE